MLGEGLKWPDLRLHPINLWSMALVAERQKTPEVEEKAHRSTLSIDGDKLTKIFNERRK